MHIRTKSPGSCLSWWKSASLVLILIYTSWESGLSLKKKILNFVSLTSVFTEENEAHGFCSGLFTNNTRTLNPYCVYTNERCVKNSEEQFCGYTVYLKTTRCNQAQQYSCEAGQAPGSVPTRRGGSGGREQATFGCSAASRHHNTTVCGTRTDTPSPPAARTTDTALLRDVALWVAWKEKLVEGGGGIWNYAEFHHVLHLPRSAKLFLALAWQKLGLQSGTSTCGWENTVSGGTNSPS